MVSVRKLIGPDFSKTPLVTFDFSGSSLILPLPKSTRPKYEEIISQVDLFDDSKHFVGNPAVERYVQALNTAWNYIAESSSLVCGSADVRLFIYTVHERTGLKGQSVLQPNILKQWIVFFLTEKYTKFFERDQEMAEFVGNEVKEENDYCFPQKPGDLTVYCENQTPKCYVRDGNPSLDRLWDTLYIPVSDCHVLSVHLNFGGFNPEYVGPEEEMFKLLDSYAAEFFSYMRMDYNDEIKAALEKIQFDEKDHKVEPFSDWAPIV